MQSYTYLLINFFTIIICFIFSFEKRIQFNKHFSAFLKDSVIVAIPSIVWYIQFTDRLVWFFNTDYPIGFIFFGLPVEELLFFICIPFSCVFTYFCLTKFCNLDWANAFNNRIVFISIIVCIFAALLNYSQIYTLFTAILTTSTLIHLHFFVCAQWIGQASLRFCILMLGFLPVNGILAGMGLETPIVNYNP